MWRKAFAVEFAEFESKGISALPLGSLIRVAFGSIGVTDEPRERLWAVAGLLNKISSGGWEILIGLREEDLFEGIWRGLRHPSQGYTGGKFPHMSANQLYEMMNPDQRLVIVYFLEEGFFAFDDNLEEVASQWARVVGL